MRTPPPVILAGLGRQGERLLDVLRAEPRISLAGLVVLHPKRARERARGLGLPLFGDLDAALAATGAKIVFIATPSHTHADLCRVATARGADAAVEKPLADSPEEARAILARAAAAGRRVLVAHTSLYSAGLLTLRRLVREGAIGAVRAVRMVSREPGGRERHPGFPGEPNVSSQWEHQAALFAMIAGGAPMLRDAFILCDAPPHEVAWLALESGGARGDFVQDNLTPGNAPFRHLEARGDGGAMEWRLAGGEERLTLAPAGCKPRRVPLDAARHDPVAGQVEALVLALLGVREPLEPPSRAVEVMEVTVRAFAHAHARRGEPRAVRVALLQLPRRRNPGDTLRLPSLALARLAAWLRQFGVTARVVDLDTPAHERLLRHFTRENVAALLTGGSAPPPLAGAVAALTRAGGFSGEEVVGFSIVDYRAESQALAALALAAEMKRAPRPPVVLFGGVWDEMLPEWIASLPSPPVDALVRGAGEVPLLEAALCAGGVLPPFAAAHLAPPAPGVEVPELWLPLDARPAPLFAPDPRPLTPDPSPPTPDVAARILPYGFMQGCAHRCFFCSYGNRIDLQPARKTVSELRMLVETTGVRDFFFLNNCLNVTARFLDDFLDALLDAGLDLLWADSLRPCQIDETRAARLFQAGCRLATMGVESGSDRVLRAMRKGFTVADSSRAVRALHAAGILTRVNLIAGFPGERPDDVEATIGFVHDHADQIDMLGCFNQFYLLPSLGRDAAAVGAVVREGSDTMPTGQRSLMFDEVGGYRWEERRAATNAAWNRINEAVARRGIFMEEAFDEARLFALFRAGRSSDEVRASLLRDLAPTGVPVLM